MESNHDQPYGYTAFLRLRTAGIMADISPPSIAHWKAVTLAGGDMRGP
jgi:hypothetical protein